MNKLASMSVGLLLLGSAVAAQAADAITGNVTLASDYRFRGISQLEGGGWSPAIQGGFDWKPASGVYLGTWASNINLTNGSIEWDLYGGYANKFNDNVSYDVGFLYYDYPNPGQWFSYESDPEAPSHKVNPNYYEFYGSITAMGVKIGVNYSPDYFAETGKFAYWYAEYSHKLGSMLTASAHVAYNWFDKSDFFFGQEDHYYDWKVGLSTDQLGVTWTLAYVDTTLGSDRKCFGNEDFCEATAVFSISKAL